MSSDADAYLPPIIARAPSISSDPGAGAPVDPLHALQAALTAPPGSLAQRSQLATLRAALDAAPGRILLLLQMLLPHCRVSAEDSEMKRWVLDLFANALGRAALSVDQRVQLAQQVFEPLAELLHDSHTPSPIRKLVIQSFTALYPVLFRWFCANRHARPQWDALTQAKARIIELLWAPTTPTGVRLTAMKFAQRAILVQTKGANDPRKTTDPNVSMCPNDHPFIQTVPLEQEAMTLLQGVMTLFYSSSDTNLLTALLNSWSALPKLRPSLTPVIIETLSKWAPTQFTTANRSATSIKSVEKAIRILLLHLSRVPAAAAMSSQIADALAQQAYRMERAAADERARRAAHPASLPLPATGGPSLHDSTPNPTPPPQAGPSTSTTFPTSDERKRSAPSTSPSFTEGPVDKKPRLAASPEEAAARELLLAFDFSTLPVSLVTDLIVDNLQRLSEAELAGLVAAYRGVPAPAPAPSAQVPAMPATQHPSGLEAGPSGLKKEETPEPEPLSAAPVIDTEEMEYEPDKLNAALTTTEGSVEMEDEDADSGQIDAEVVLQQLADLKIPPGKEISDEEERHKVIRQVFGRLWRDVEARSTKGREKREEVQQMGSAELWLLLVVRLVSRTQTLRPVGMTVKNGEGGEVKKKEETEGDVEWEEVYDRQDQLRRMLCDFVLADFAGRVGLATAWMNEEWYNDHLRKERDRNFRENYETWLGQLVAAVQTQADARPDGQAHARDNRDRDRAFSRFLLDLPEVPADVLGLLRELCVDPERREVGFAALRGFVAQRATLREDAMMALLDLTTHPDKLTRAAAINTVRRWVPDAQPMAEMARDFALQLLRRLHARPNDANGEGDMLQDEDGQLAPDALFQTPYLTTTLTIPAEKLEMLQHVELIFALCVKLPELLDEIFHAYGSMDTSVQDMVQELITPLVRSLGPSHGRLLMSLRAFPPGADGLFLRILKIFTDNGRPSAPLVALVKGLIVERELDVRFLVPIIAELDKAEITKHIPRVVGTLDGTAEKKALVRSVFVGVVQTPAQTFGAVTSNQPRVKQSDLLSPTELMVLLHEGEKEVGLKPTIEAIGICFTMTDVYTPNVLGAVMQQIVEQPNLPTLFLRTVIQAVTTYKSMVNFVSTTLFNRLIIKRVWINPPLWEGFIRCAKLIAPASYASLLQLPHEQLRDVVDRQPGLKAGLREYVSKNVRNSNRAKLTSLLEILGDEAPQQQAQPVPVPGQDTTGPPHPPPAPIQSEVSAG